MVDELGQDLRRRLAKVDVDPDERWVARLRAELSADWPVAGNVTVGPRDGGPGRRWRRAGAVAAALLVAATAAALFVAPRLGEGEELPRAIEVELPTVKEEGGRIVFETAVGRIVWTRVGGPLGSVASSPLGVFTLQLDSDGVRVRRYDADSSWHDVASIETSDRWGGLGRVSSDRDLYFFSIEAGCEDLALGDGGLAPSPGAERCLALERSPDGGVTFERFELEMPDAFVPLEATITSGRDFALLDATGTGERDHRYWANTNGKWQLVEVPWSTNRISSAEPSASIVSDGESLIAYAADGSAAWRSTDGTTWTPVDVDGLPLDAEPMHVTRTPQGWIAIIDGRLYISGNGVEWQLAGEFSDSAPWEALASLGDGAVLAPTKTGTCVAVERASLRVTSDGSTWSELLQADTPPSTSFTGAPSRGEICVQLTAADTIIIEFIDATGTPSGSWLGQLEELER
jgi:hypothetical protein